MRSKKPRIDSGKGKVEDQDSVVSGLKAQLARALADYDNLKKRTETEKSIWFKVAGGRVIGKFLPIRDMLEDAQKHLKDQGLGIVLGEFKKAFEEEGFEEVKVEVGVSDFDEKVMEAIESVETNEAAKNNKVAEVVLSGWKAKGSEFGEDDILRHVKVKVYKVKSDQF